MQSNPNKTKTIGSSRTLKAIITNSDVPTTHIGRIIDGASIDVPLSEPNSGEGVVSLEEAYWSTLQANRAGLKMGFVVGLIVSGLLIGLILYIYHISV